MMRRLSLVLLVLVLVGCGDEVTEDEEKEIVKPDTGLEKEIVWEKDGKEMVLIPAGSFEMGDHHDNMKDALPVHTVKLDAFYMDVYEVTEGQFREFLSQSGYIWEGPWDGVAAKSSKYSEYPMVHVSWHDATAYAEWAGKRLPTEAEWEYAARGGLVGKRYPWGDEITPDDANYGETVFRRAVGSYPANGYGLYDVAGNVREWCADFYKGDYYQYSRAKNPPGPARGSSRVLRGGSWSSDAHYLQVDYRYGNAPNYGNGYDGFRCVSGSN